MKRLIFVLALMFIFAAYVTAAPRIRIIAPDGTSLKGALVKVELLDGRSYEFILDPDNPFRIKDVPLGIMKVTVVSWKGVPVGYSEEIKIGEKDVIVVPNIGKLVVRTIGSRGQSLGGVVVKVLYQGQLVEEGVTDESGIYSVLLPNANYEIRVSYGGEEKVKQVSVPGEAEFSFDVFVELHGTPFSSTEFIGLLVLTIILVVITYIVAVEYSNWRRRRLVKVVK
ncbi:MAG: hypothetical protein DRJ35_07195 [Thermoprotei archaeon]|nr:MAG: hypothetical protein DRJ35_07195 [Thermoprotei archaeon]